jgi:hypothetical protein
VWKLEIKVEPRDHEPRGRKVEGRGLHGIYEQWESRSESASHQIISGVGACNVAWVCVAEVAEDGHEEEKSADGEEGTPDDGHDPVDRRPGRPSEPADNNLAHEQPDGTTSHDIMV